MHRSHFLHLYAVEKYNVLLHIKDKSNKLKLIFMNNILFQQWTWES